jgi:hypothetical protein
MAEDSHRKKLEATAANNPALGSAEARSVEFYVPRAAGDALRAVEITAAARAAGCLRPVYEYRTVGVPTGKALIVADHTLAPFIVEAFVEMTKQNHGAIVIAAAAAAMSALEALAP